MINQGNTKKIKINHDQIILDLFDKMSTIYGSLWAKYISLSTLISCRDEWMSSLGGIKPSQVRRACELITTGRSRFNKFPPNCIEFAQLARIQPSDSETEAYIPNETPKGGIWEEEIQKRMSNNNLLNKVGEAKLQKNPIKYLLSLEKRNFNND
jgi:hypothetical protein